MCINLPKKYFKQSLTRAQCIALYLVSTTIWCSLLIFSPNKGLADSVLTIEVTSSHMSALPMAISPFSWQADGLPSQDVAMIIQNDLTRSGQFKLLPRADMLSRPNNVDQVIYRDWRILGTEYLLVGQVLPNPAGGGSINFQLLDVYQGKRVPLLKTGISVDNLRDGAHYISDLIYEKLVGLKGAFSTEILYVTVQQLENGKREYQLQKADADGHRAKTILKSSEPILSPSWAPDGKHIAYVSYEKTRPAIYMQNVITGKKRQLTHFKGINGAPDWSPDGRHMVMTLSKDGNPELYQLNLETGKFKRLTQHYAIDTEPRYSPDGRSVIFTSNRGGTPQIYQLFLSDLSVKRLTFEGNYNARGLISPDGENLVFVHRKNKRFHIAIQSLEGRGLRVLTQTDLDESPTVAPNGTMLLYATSDRKGKGLLAAVSIDGNTKMRLPVKVGEVREPSWSPFLR